MKVIANNLESYAGDYEKCKKYNEEIDKSIETVTEHYLRKTDKESEGARWSMILIAVVAILLSALSRKLWVMYSVVIVASLIVLFVDLTSRARYKRYMSELVDERVRLSKMYANSSKYDIADMLTKADLTEYMCGAVENTEGKNVVTLYFKEKESGAMASYDALLTCKECSEDEEEYLDLDTLTLVAHNMIDRNSAVGWDA